MQHGEEDCLYACYAMVLSGLGHQVALNDLLDGGFLPPDGASLRSLRALNSRFGLDMRAVRATVSDLRSLPRRDRRGPLIAHWDGRHFVVLTKLGRSRVSLVDPALGPVTLTWSDFERRYSGVVVRFETTETFRRGNEVESPVSALRGIGMGGALTFVLSLVLAQLSSIALSAVVKHLLGVAGPVLGPGVGLLVALVALALAGQVLRYVGMRRLSQDFEKTYVASLFGCLLRQPLEYFSRRGTGSIMEKLSMRNSLRDSLVLTVAPSLLSCLSIVGLTAYLAWISVQLTLVIVLVSGLFTVAQALNAIRHMRANQAFTQAQVMFSSIAQRDLTNIIETKARQDEDHLANAWVGRSAELLGAYRDVMRSTVSGSLVQQLYVVISTVGVVVAGLLLHRSTGFELPTIIVFQAAMGAFLAAAADVQSLVLNFTVARVYFDSHQDFFHSRTVSAEIGRMGQPGDTLLQAGGLDVLLPGGAPVLSGVDLNVRQGDVVAVTGPSGAGKSSLLLGLLGQRDIRGQVVYADDGLRRDLGVVFPEMRLVGSTLREVLGCEDDDAALLALDMVGLSGQSEFMPRGLDSAVTAGGANMSAGQRQRLLVARSLLLGSRLLIWDEPFSNLDDGTRRRLCERVFARLGDRAVVMVSHHLDVLQWANVIVHILPGGRCLVGTLEELRQVPEFAEFIGAGTEARAPDEELIPATDVGRVGTRQDC